MIILYELSTSIYSNHQLAIVVITVGTFFSLSPIGPISLLTPSASLLLQFHPSWLVMVGENPAVISYITGLKMPFSIGEPSRNGLDYPASKLENITKG